jgi:hypothetical protein
MWGFQTMFSAAAKFVVAGVVVALLGGFLLVGPLTRPSDDRPPAVGASASAQAEPTDALTASPDPSVEVVRDDATIRSDLLPGVDLVTGEVEPGVYRVLSDGIRDLMGAKISFIDSTIVAVGMTTPFGPTVLIGSGPTLDPSVTVGDRSVQAVGAPLFRAFWLARSR